MMDVIELYDSKREKLFHKVFLCSGLSVLMAVASRTPTWEIASPVDWITGPMNVGYIPIFGPFVIFGLFCSVMVSSLELRGLRQALIQSTCQSAWKNEDRLPAGILAQLTRPARGFVTEVDLARWDRVAAGAIRLWVLVVPVVAYLVLVISYFDFVRPSETYPNEWLYKSRTMQVVDLLVGTGGWGGFKPIAPSIQDNLNKLADQASTTPDDQLVTGGVAPASDPEEALRLRRLADSIPWIYPPVQTWLYLSGLVLMVLMAWSQRKGETMLSGGPEKADLSDPSPEQPEESVQETEGRS